MNRYLLIVLVIVLSVSFLSFPPVLSGAEEEELEYSWGTITRKGVNEITVSEYDYDSDEYVEVVYKIAEDAEIRNAESLQYIGEGDDIEIDYMTKGVDRIAMVVTLEEPTPEEEYAPSEMYDEGDEEEFEYVPETEND